jgi:hypothetical protein
MLGLTIDFSLYFRLFSRPKMAIPNIQTIDMANIRENSPKPTTDVKFTFVDQKSGEKLELNAHKLILAFGSEVFMTQFWVDQRREGYYSCRGCNL